MFPSSIIPTLPCCIGTMFVAGTLAVTRWLLALVLDIPLQCGCCFEEGGGPMVCTLSIFCWVDFVLLITVVLTSISCKRTCVFPPCGLSLVSVSMCPGLFLVHYLILCLYHPCGQQYSGRSVSKWTYVFCLLSLPPMLFLVVAMVETCCDNTTTIYLSAAISLDIVALDLLSVALDWVSLEKVF